MSLLLGLALGATDATGECEEQALFVPVPDTLRASGNSLGLNLNDFDGDGDIDVLVATGPARVEHAVYYPGESLLYLNEGDLQFSEVGEAWGVDDLCEDRAPLFGDLDNDGLADLYFTVNGENLLLHNTGERFEDVTAWSGDAGHEGWGHEAALLDFDRDGFLDVFFTNGPEDGSGRNVLLQNLGDGTLLDVSDSAGVAGSRSGKGTCVLDADLDGWPDLFVTTGREHGNELFMNQGGGRFDEQALERGLSDPAQRFGVGVVCEDLDSDGDPDILLVTHDKAWTGNQLFRNDGGHFTDVAAEAGLVDFVDGHGLAAVDLDLDGDLDVVLSGINTPPQVFRNDGELRFTRLCDGAGVQQPSGVTWAVAGADLDGDAYPEILISNGLGRRPRSNSLYRNRGGDAHFLTVEVVGVVHNPSQLGAQVQVVLEDRTLTRWVGSWSSFDSQGPLALTFGLGSAERVKQLRVQLTDGSVQVLEDLEVDQRVVVTEEVPWEDDDFDGVPDGWDACPGTPLGWRSDLEGCTWGQRRGLAVGLEEPARDAVVASAPGFRWSGEVQSAVVQVGTDGGFGPAGRIDLGPVSGNRLELDAEQWEALRQASDGSRPLLWRVVAVADDGAERITEPRRLYVAVDADVVRVPYGANVFRPAHIRVPAGTAVTWWNDSVAAGNLQNEIHDVQLYDAAGEVLSAMWDLDGAAAWTWTFPRRGFYSAVCHRHSGYGSHGDGVHETTTLPHGAPPHRCMSGTVTVY